MTRRRRINGGRKGANVKWRATQGHKGSARRRRAQNGAHGVYRGRARPPRINIPRGDFFSKELCFFWLFSFFGLFGPKLHLYCKDHTFIHKTYYFPFYEWCLPLRSMFNLIYLLKVFKHYYDISRHQVRRKVINF